MRKITEALFLIFLTGCGVNQAVYDPFSTAPQSHCNYYTTNCSNNPLHFWNETATCAELPPENHPLSLAEVLDIALVNNPKTEISWAQARQAAAEYGISQSSFFPLITSDFHYERDRTAYLTSQAEPSQNINQEVVIVNNQSRWGPQAHLTWTLLDFGERRYTSEAARYALYSANFTHNDTIQLVVENVTIRFFDYLSQAKQLEANEADLANAEETLAAAKVGLRQGVKNVSDVLQARTQTLLAEITLSQKRKRVNASYAALIEQMGLPANQTLQFEKLPYLEPEKVELQSLDAFIETAMQCRPDILASRALVESAEMSLKAAKRLSTPTLNYSLEMGHTYFNGAFQYNYDFTSTFSLSMPLFTGYNIKNTVRSAQSKVKAAMGTLRENELLAIGELRAAHFDVGVAHDTLKFANQYLLTAKDEYVVVLDQYKSGVNTILDVISAQSTLFDARAKQAEATQQWFTSLATLTYSAGIFFQPSGQSPCECST
jgi:outer membrane protein TolC